MIRRTCLIALVPALVQLVPISSLRAAPLAAAGAQRSYSSDSSRPRPSGQWSMFMNGPLRRGRTPIIGAQSPTLVWRIPTETNYGGAAVGRDGTIYQGTDFGQLLAINPDGSIKWTMSGPYRVSENPAVMLDGRIVFVDEGGGVHVVNPDGSPSWGFDTGHTFPRAPAIGWDGTIYTFSGQTIYALRPDGSKRWASDIVGGVAAPVSVTLSGVVYAASAYLFALDPGGHQLWRSDNYFLGGAPAVGPDGTIYANSQLGATFHAFNPDGSLKWSYQAAECCTPDIPSSPAIGTDGTIYVGEDLSGAGRVYAFNPDGSVKWQFDITGLAPTSISLGGDGTIYFGSGNGGAGPPTVYALNPDGTLKWQYSESIGGYVRTTPSIGVGQRIYAGTADAFFAIGP